MCLSQDRDKREAVVNAVINVVYVLSLLWGDFPCKEYFLYSHVVRFRVYFWGRKDQGE
jgi:hypothetical protein